MVSDDEEQRRLYAVRFQDRSVVERYHLRAAYPEEVFTLLRGLIVDEPRAVLDVGCGPGMIARGLVEAAERVDAVDMSEQMLELARVLPGGDAPRVRWLLGRVEEVELEPPYALITAGRSLHWLDWEVALPRFAQLVTAHGVLAIIQTREQGVAWSQALREVMGRYSGRGHPWRREMVEQLERARLFQRLGEHTTVPVVQRWTVEDYIAGQHSKSGLSLERMGAEEAQRFDEEVGRVLAPFEEEGVLSVEVVGHIVWGQPLSGERG